ncbi:orotate phosphoribosyltransferase [bacterium]|nr:orotate phosphoribosyltransferase [candidate division CSSED10-310 bacterium]
MNKERVFEILRETNALLEGHFKLSSGKHSNKYLQCARVLQFPTHARILGKLLGQRFSDMNIDGVIAPAIGGIIIAHEVAGALGVRAIFGERNEGRMSLRRGFQISRGERFLVIEDVITTGKSTREIIELLYSFEGILAGVCAIADRSNSALNLPCHPESLVQLDVSNWDPDECPLCKANYPLTTPGSRFLK